jgi:hypothetical protein
MARENTQIKHPSIMERHDKKVDKFVCAFVCDANRAPKTPVHQIIVIGLEIART